MLNCCAHFQPKALCMSSLNQALSVALDNRQSLLAELHEQGTDCYRLFHDNKEGFHA
jgi:23S rRNA (cytosine1962-C5)-methyltransferase